VKLLPDNDANRVFIAALLIWMQHRHALRARGYSFAQFRQHGAARIQQLLRSQPLPASSHLEGGSSNAGTFERRDLRARW
jgi:hypothetical protein